MAKTTKEEHKEIVLQKRALAKLIMEKIGMSYNEFIEDAEARLLAEYADILTQAERKKYGSKIVFGDDLKKDRLTITKADFTTIRGKMIIYLSDGGCVTLPVSKIPAIKKLPLKVRQQYFIIDGVYVGFLGHPYTYYIHKFLY